MKSRKRFNPFASLKSEGQFDPDVLRRASRIIAAYCQYESSKAEADELRQRLNLIKQYPPEHPVEGDLGSIPLA